MCRRMGPFSIFVLPRPFSFFSGRYAFLFLVFRVHLFALLRLLHITFAVGPSDPLFSVRSGSPPSSRPLTFRHFSSFLARVVAALGLDPRAYSPHSFRRGGATFAFECNVPAEHIKFQGDSSSDAYLVYLELSPAQKQRAVNSMATKIHQLS